MLVTSNISKTNSSFFNYSEKVQKNACSGYELSNHLGNVLAVITDRRIQTCGMGDVMHYEAQVVSISDYYPFGMGIKDREWKDSTFSYRFGFNGKEKDNEVNGDGNCYDYGFRIYNSRLSRFLTVDPLISKYPYLTSYQYAHNRPILCIDLDGLEGVLSIDASLISNEGMPTIRAATGESVQIVFVYYVEKVLVNKTEIKALTSAFKDLESGNLYGTDGKLYHTERMATYDAIISDGVKYINVKKGVNFGVNVVGKQTTTAGIDQLKIFKTKSIWNAFSNLAKMAWIIDFADMAIAYSNGDVSTTLPLSFVGANMNEEGKDIIKQAIKRQMVKSIGEGLEATKDFVKGKQFQNLKGFKIVEVDLETMNKIYSGEIKNNNELLDATSKYDLKTKKEYSILIEESSGSSLIRAIFKTDFNIEKPKNK